MDKGQIAKLVCVAPLNRDSDQMRGKRMIAGGRKRPFATLSTPCPPSASILASRRSMQS